LSEGRRSFLAHYEGIESGDTCRQWLPVISAMVDGEASREQLLELRPHLRNCSGCRATLRALQDSGRPLAALLPVGLIAPDGGLSDQVSHAVMRAYEALAGGMHERAINSFTKAQAVVEASTAGKLAVVAASAAALAGGGYASVQHAARPPVAARPATTMRAQQVAPAIAKTASWSPAVVRAALAKTGAATPASSHPKRTHSEFSRAARRKQTSSAPEFSPKHPTRRDAPRLVYAASNATPPAPPAAPPPPPPVKPAPEFATPAAAAPEFTP
jgi:hypothetical protein